MAVDPKAEKAIRERAERLFEQAGGDARRLSLLAAQYAGLAEGATPGEFLISGGISSRDGSPFVSFQFGGDFAFQQTPEAARDLALTIFEAAETAVSDSAMFAWLVGVLFVGDADAEVRAANVIGIVRDFRRDRWGIKDEQPTEPEGPA